MPTYTITELAREFDITPRAIRFYEDQGLITPKREGVNGHVRVYSGRERTRLKLTLRGKRLGLSLAEIKSLVDMYESPRDSVPQLKRVLSVLAQHREALEQQTATSEILGVIASSPTNIQPVLDVVAENAARLCEATDAQIRLVEGGGHRLVASFGPLWAPEFRVTDAENPFSRALLTRETVHVHDLHATILALLGFDHEKLTYRHAGRDFRLTDVHGKVVRDLIA